MRVDPGGHTLRVQGSGAEPLHFVCLHGLADALDIWDQLAPALAQRRRVACDRLNQCRT